MSAVFSAVEICERALRAIGAFPVTDSSADGAQLREAMFWLDLILAENAGTDNILFLLPSPIQAQFTLLNGTGNYDLTNALGATAPIDGVQFPVAAYLLIPSGRSVVGFSTPIPGTVAIGDAVVDMPNAQAVAPDTSVVAINTGANQITLSGPSTVAIGDTLQIGTSQLVCTGTVPVAGGYAGVGTVQRQPVPLVQRDVFLRARNPEEYGRPRMIYIDRVPDSQFYLHPFPAPTDTQLYIIELDVQTYAPNVAPAGVTGTQPQAEVLTNFRQAWQRYLVAQLSHDLGAGPIFKLPEPSLNRFGAMAAAAKERLLAFENREHEDTPPICEAFDRSHGYGDFNSLRDYGASWVDDGGYL